MKKPAKLVLNRETLRSLNLEQLKHAAGGGQRAFVTGDEVCTSHVDVLTAPKS